MLGKKMFGEGENKVLVLPEWLYSPFSYEKMLNYLDFSKFTFCFLDLRGYGDSKFLELDKSNLLEQACNDINKVINKLEWKRFSVIGNCMSSMIAQKLVSHIPERLDKVILVSPVTSIGLSEFDMDFKLLEDGAKYNDDVIKNLIFNTSSKKLDKKFVELKTSGWREYATFGARLAYLNMFVKSDFRNEITNHTKEMLIITGSNDARQYKQKYVEKIILRDFPNATIMELSNAGHYPMQEIPEEFSKIIQDYISTKKKIN